MYLGESMGSFLKKQKMMLSENPRWVFLQPR